MQVAAWVAEIPEGMGEAAPAALILQEDSARKPGWLSRTGYSRGKWSYRSGFLGSGPHFRICPGDFFCESCRAGIAVGLAAFGRCCCSPDSHGVALLGKLGRHGSV